MYDSQNWALKLATIVHRAYQNERHASLGLFGGAEPLLDLFAARLPPPKYQQPFATAAPFCACLNHCPAVADGTSGSHKLEAAPMIIPTAILVHNSQAVGLCL